MRKNERMKRKEREKGKEWRRKDRKKINNRERNKAE
jgi:hypothetical protein